MIPRTTRSSGCPPYYRDRHPIERQHRVWLALTFVFTTVVTLPAQDVATANSAPAPSTSQFGALPDAPSTSRESEAKSLTGGAEKLVKTIGLDEWHIIKAPFQKKALVWDAVVLGATGVLIANDESVAHQVQTQWHDTSINVSSATVYATAATAGGIYVTGLFTHSDHAQETGIRSAEAAIDSALLYGAMKAIMARQRPYMGNGDGKFFSGNWSSGSFPSGHSTMAWTLASVVAHEYPSWPVRILMYGLATTASTARVTAGVHFPADVFAGGVMGYLIGDYVASKPSAKKISTAQSHSRIRRMPEAVLQHVAIGGQ